MSTSLLNVFVVGLVCMVGLSASTGVNNPSWYANITRNTNVSGTSVGSIQCINTTQPSCNLVDNLIVALANPPPGLAIPSEVRQFYYAGHFIVTGLPTAGTVDVVVQYPCSSNVNSVLKFHPVSNTQLINFVYDGDTGTGFKVLGVMPGGLCGVQITVQDGGRGDDDLTADTNVIDPFFLAYSVDSGTDASMVAQALIPTIIFVALGFGVLVGWLFARSRMAGSSVYAPMTASQ